MLWLMTFALQRYLAELVLAQQPLPRRQEAESLKFTSGGITQTALVTHEEVQEWATGSRRAIMCSISHAWETREHPDPCRQGTGLFWILFSSASLCLEHKLAIISYFMVSMNAWLLFPWLLWLPCFFLHVLSRTFVQWACRNSRCGVAFCLHNMWCDVPFQVDHLSKWVGVVCKISRGEPTHLVDLSFCRPLLFDGWMMLNVDPSTHFAATMWVTCMGMGPFCGDGFVLLL